jgi:hypothetical protein
MSVPSPRSGELRYDLGHASLGRSSDMPTQANFEMLLRYRLNVAGPQLPS